MIVRNLLQTCFFPHLHLTHSVNLGFGSTNPFTTVDLSHFFYLKVILMSIETSSKIKVK